MSHAAHMFDLNVQKLKNNGLSLPARKSEMKIEIYRPKSDK